jgi:hypothetical protein
MKSLKDWTRTHPCKALVFLALAVAGGVVAANRVLDLL